MTELKICIAASAGGHLSQLLSLQSAWQGCRLICVSTGLMVRQKLEAMGNTYIVGECNRQHPVKSFMVMMKCFRIILKEKPNVVISTGAAAGFFMCFWGKVFRAKVIWIDSIANARKLSMSGRLACFFADVVLSQWPTVAAQYSKVEYAGEVI